MTRPQVNVTAWLSRFISCKVIALCGVFVLSLAAETPAAAQTAATSQPAQQTLQIDPSQALLLGRSSVQQLLVTAIDASGIPRDVTREAQFTSSDAKIAQVLPGGFVQAVSDGVVQIAASWNGQETRITLEIHDADRPRAIHFRNDVLPLLTKAGCNAGGCHGKASGQNGFKLTVFNFDPDFDYDALVKQARGRRVFPSAPEKSLLLLKPTAQIPHGGGRRIEVDSAAYELLLEWLRQGMPRGAQDAASVTAIEVFPKERILTSNAQQQLLVAAVYSDGSRRDVTRQAEYSSNLPPLADVDSSGLVSSGVLPGEVAVMVRYLGQVASMKIILPRPQKIDPYPLLPENNFLDPLVWAKLRKLQILPSELAEDAEFLRRVYLDTIGTLPTPEEARSFLADSDNDKRPRLIDRLLDRPEFADYWALRWADVLRIDREALGARGAYLFYRWLRDAVAANMPYSEMVRWILVAQGNSAEVGPVNLYRAVSSPSDLTNTVSQVFLGVRIECAQCHHHPYEKWGQDDFYGMAAYFAPLQRKDAVQGAQWVYVNSQGDLKHPRTGETVLAYPLDGRHWRQAQSSNPASETLHATAPHPRTSMYESDVRHHLADWMTAPENPWFSRMIANRLWAHYLGRGLVEPVDDLRATNPASNEALLDALSQHVVASGFDLKQVMRTILNSRVYQLSSATHPTNEDDGQNYSHARIKPLPAEVLLDAICQATQVPEKFVGVSAGSRAIQLWDNRLQSYFLNIFGRPLRASPCECERANEPSIAQALHLMNSSEIQAKVADRSGRVARLIHDQASDDQIIEDCYLALLSRLPRLEERQAALQFLSQRRSTRRQTAEDLFWALLNSYEFLFNH